MTSEAFVWIYLPGDTRLTLCGRFTHDLTATGLASGQFVYGKTYLANTDAIALDPIALPLGPKTYGTQSLNGTFSALNDAMPDDWGRYVIDKTRGSSASP